jgi:hypothetical protein
MSDTWQDAQGKLWFGYWRTALDGTWHYELHPEGADTDMSDMSIDEVHQSFGPLKRGEMVKVPETVIRKRFRATS